MKQLDLPGQTHVAEGPLDHTGMYVMHHAFRRDLARFAAAATATPLGEPDTWAALSARWDRFTHVLHEHHHAEDTHYWPVLHAAVSARGTDADRAEVTAMSDEHAEIDPALTALTIAWRAMADHPCDDHRHALEIRLAGLRELLGAHLEHEETVVLPLVQRVMTQDEMAGVELAIQKGNRVAREGMVEGEQALRAVQDAGLLRRLQPVEELVGVELGDPGEQERRVLTSQRCSQQQEVADRLGQVADPVPDDRLDAFGHLILDPPRLLGEAGQLDEEEGVAVGPCPPRSDDVGLGIGTEDRADEVARLVVGETAELEGGGAMPGQGGVELRTRGVARGTSARDDSHPVAGTEARDDLGEAAHRRGVGPVEVVEDEEQAGVLGRVAQGAGDGVVRGEGPLRCRAVGRVAARVAASATAGTVSELGWRRQVEPGEELAPRPQRWGALVRRARADARRHAALGRLGHRPLDESRLAGACLTDEAHRGRPTGDRVVEPLAEDLALAGPAHDRPLVPTES